MKLILTAAVENLGVPGDIVEVKNGYGRNYLLPRNLAIVATRGAEKQIATMKRAQEERAIRDLDHAREVKEQLEALTDVSISVRTSEKGKIFGSVSADNIAAAIKAAGGPKLDKRSIELQKGAVKTVGSYSVNVKLHSDSATTVNFQVVAAYQPATTVTFVTQRQQHKTSQPQRRLVLFLHTCCGKFKKNQLVI